MANENERRTEDVEGEQELPPVWPRNEMVDAESELTVTEHRDHAAGTATQAEQQRLSEALDGERAVPEGASEDVVSSPARRGMDHPDREIP